MSSAPSTVHAISDHLRQVKKARAGHESARTTGLYDRRNEMVQFNEAEKVVF